jgi:hypothetical protein
MNWVLNSIRGKKFFSSFKIQTSSRTYPFFCSVGTGAVLGVKWLGNEFSHFPASGSKVKDEWICTATSPVCLLYVCGQPLPLFSLCRNIGIRTGDL